MLCALNKNTEITFVCWYSFVWSAAGGHFTTTIRHSACSYQWTWVRTDTHTHTHTHTQKWKHNIRQFDSVHLADIGLMMFWTSATVYKSGRVETLSRIIMHSRQQKSFFTVITVQIYVNCGEAWFCIKWQSYTIFRYFITARCTIVQSVVLRSHVVCLSVCPSVSLWPWWIMSFHDHIGWKSWKLIAWTISPTSSLFVAQRSSTYSQRNMEKFWGENVRSTDDTYVH